MIAREFSKAVFPLESVSDGKLLMDNIGATNKVVGQPLLHACSIG